MTTKQEVLDKLAVYCGGRAAEELIFGEMTTGAANDIEQATKLARNMITRFGMSDEFGMMALGTVQNAYLNQGILASCSRLPPLSALTGLFEADHRGSWARYAILVRRTSSSYMSSPTTSIRRKPSLATSS